MAQEAQKHGIVLVCYAQWGDDGIGRTETLPRNIWQGARIASYAARAAGNVIFALERDTKEHGHNSAVLHLMNLQHSKKSQKGGGR